LPAFVSGWLNSRLQHHFAEGKNCVKENKPSTSVRKRKTKSVDLRIGASKDVSNRCLIVIDVARIETSIQPPQNFFKKLDNNSYSLRGSSA
jgi:hypothetical protein